MFSQSKVCNLKRCHLLITLRIICARCSCTCIACLILWLSGLLSHNRPWWMFASFVISWFTKEILRTWSCRNVIVGVPMSTLVTVIALQVVLTWVHWTFASILSTALHLFQKPIAVEILKDSKDFDLFVWSQHNPFVIEFKCSAEANFSPLTKVYKFDLKWLRLWQLCKGHNFLWTYFASVFICQSCKSHRRLYWWIKRLRKVKRYFVYEEALLLLIYPIHIIRWLISSSISFVVAFTAWVMEAILTSVEVYMHIRSTPMSSIIGVNLVKVLVFSYRTSAANLVTHINVPKRLNL